MSRYFEELAGERFEGLPGLPCIQTEDARFADRQYRRNPTHVVFYRESTVHRIAAQRGWTCECPVKGYRLDA